jgi:hypothetical protein
MGQVSAIAVITSSLAPKVNLIAMILSKVLAEDHC